MPLTYTHKEHVLNALEVVLKTISWCTDVDRQHVGLSEYTRPKGCMIYDVRETRNTIAYDCVKVNLTVMVTVYVLAEGDDAEKLSTLLNEAIEDVKRVIEANPTLNDVVDDVTIDSVDTGMGFAAPSGDATLSLSISFLSEV